VAGEAGGLRLGAPPGTGTRPTSDRVREAVFNALDSLGAVDDAVVADLFAGSGALGIEALSRGAASAAFVDADRAAVQAIEANLAHTGLADRARVVRGDVVDFLAGAPGPFDLMLIDPPYERNDWPELLAGAVSCLSPDGVIVAESDREVEPPEGGHTTRIRRYGGTVVTFLRPIAGGPPTGAPT
jgi:16S rRNA (guanine966-N2)-methyltransferase